jgi:preprotein translocase subunit SecG
MLKITLTICCLILIFLILTRIPSKDGGSFNFKMESLGSPQNTNNSLQNFIWFFVFSFFAIVTIKQII